MNDAQAFKFYRLYQKMSVTQWKRQQTMRGLQHPRQPPVVHYRHTNLRSPRHVMRNSMKRRGRNHAVSARKNAKIAEMIEQIKAKREAKYMMNHKEAGPSVLEWNANSLFSALNGPSSAEKDDAVAAFERVAASKSASYGGGGGGTRKRRYR